jgi:hypothetical protein
MYYIYRKNEKCTAVPTEAESTPHTRKNITVELVCNNIGLCNISPIASDILWYQFFLTADHNIILLGYNNTPLLGHKMFSPFHDVITAFDLCGHRSSEV